MQERAAVPEPNRGDWPDMTGLPPRILVAGGAGFIGSHICEALLARGHHVTCLDNFLTGTRDNIRHLEADPRFTVVNADVVDPLPASIRPDTILNLACAASPEHYQADPVHTMMTSVVGTRNLLALAAKRRARLLLASTSEVYGDPTEHPQRENYFGNVNPTGPRACYDEGKRAAETLCFDHLRAGRVDVRVARIFNTYGPRMRADDGRVISNVITQALSGRDITLYGTGQQTRSFCFVEDMVEGLLRLLAFPREVPGPINLGNPREITIAELVERVRAMTGSRSRVVHKPLPADDPKRRCPDISLGMRLLDWSPRVSVEIGLARTIAWFGVKSANKPIANRRRQSARPHPAIAAESAPQTELSNCPRVAVSTA
jgi:UDP-glucuronate decarboxylase